MFFKTKCMPDKQYYPGPLKKRYLVLCLNLKLFQKSLLFFWFPVSNIGVSFRFTLAQ